MSDLDLDAIAELIHAELDDDDAAHGHVRTDLAEDPDLVPGSVWLRVVGRLRANQLPDGGEWRDEYGVEWDDDKEPAVIGHYTLPRANRRVEFARSHGINARVIQRRVWLGPVGPIDPAASR